MIAELAAALATRAGLPTGVVANVDVLRGEAGSIRVDHRTRAASAEAASLTSRS